MTSNKRPSNNNHVRSRKHLDSKTRRNVEPPRTTPDTERGLTHSPYVNGPLYERMSEDLHLGGMSKRTHEGYLRAVRQLADFCQRTPAQMKIEDVKSLPEVLTIEQVQQIIDACTTHRKCDRSPAPTSLPRGLAGPLRQDLPAERGRLTELRLAQRRGKPTRQAGCRFSRPRARPVGSQRLCATKTR